MEHRGGGKSRIRLSAWSGESAQISRAESLEEESSLRTMSMDSVVSGAQSLLTARISSPAVSVRELLSASDLLKRRKRRQKLSR